MPAPPSTDTVKRYTSDRWQNLDRALKGGMDEYVRLRRQERHESWHTIAAAIARDTARRPGIAPPTVSTLTRWYPEQRDTAA